MESFQCSGLDDESQSPRTHFQSVSSSEGATKQDGVAKTTRKKNRPKQNFNHDCSDSSNCFGISPQEKKKVKSTCSENVCESSKNAKSVKDSKKMSRQASTDSSSYNSKVNASDNLRKSFNRQMSLPSESSGDKGSERVASGKFPKSSKGSVKSPIQNNKPRTPDSRGASGFTPDRKGNAAKRGIKFEPYIPLSQIQQGLKRGEFIEGALRINPRNYEDAYVSSPDGKMDIYIGGMQNRNRALNGDVVVVQINPKQEWKVLCDAIKDYQERSGRSFADTICEPISPATACKVHTPDPFVRPRPFSSNSWDATRAHRSPDTLEILGIDKISKQMKDMSVRSKANSRKKQKDKKQPGGSQMNSATSLSQDSLEDCGEKLSPELHGDKSLVKNGALNAGSSVLPSSSVVEENVNISSPNAQQEEACSKQAHTGGTKTVEGLSSEDKWLENENSLNIVISPDELLQIDGHSLLTLPSFNDNQSTDSPSDEDAVIVAPEDLSGDEFTDSASLGSDHLESMIEDADFLACNQDAQNNNVEFVSQNMDHIISYSNNQQDNIQSSIDLTTSVVNAQCKIQFNKSVPSVMQINSNSEVVLSELSEVKPQNDLENVSQGSVLLHTAASENSLVSETVSHTVQLSQNSCAQKRKRRRRRPKRPKSDNQSVNEKIENIVKTFNDIHALTVDQVMEHPEWTRFVQKTGKVVHILERKHSCLAVGHLKLLPDRNVKWALFSPKDSRIPRMMVPMSDCPPNFYHRSHDFANVLFLGRIMDWEDNCNYASGRLVKELGNRGDIDVETEGILVENGVDFQDFEEDVLACLPQESDWVVPERELCKRRDFRNQCVFTIDPSTARDMDDAVSCILLKNGNYEVGVHIADVSYFVQEGTRLDSVAAERATSVYLVHKVVPMLPRRLCDELCSLNPGENRLTYSVVWEMSPEGEIFEQWIGRSVINSCIKLSYEHAQDMIENPTRTWNESEHPPMHGSFTIYDVSKRVNELHSIAVNLRAQRFMEGALHLDQVKMQFTLNAENGLPSGFNMYVQRDSNKLIEEFMLLANMTVARKIYETFPKLAMLRRHPPPEHKPMQDVIRSCETAGIFLDASSSGSLQTSIARYRGDDFLSASMVQVLMNLCSKPMNCALYFCTGALEEVSKFCHYALNVPLYTHFTSPIRRYPDIIVHRLLGAALDYGPIPPLTPTQMQKCATHCNDKKYNAKRVSELSSEMFLAAFIRNLGSLRAKAMVVGVMDHSFDCLILEMGLVKRVYCDKLPLLEKRYTKSEGLTYLNLIWKDSAVKDGLKQTITMFTLVDVVMVVEEGTFQMKVMLTKPKE